MGPNISTPFSYPCSMISTDVLKEEINYKKIDDEKVFKKVSDLFNSYEASKDSAGINTRIKVLIHRNSITDTLCLGEYFSTYKNGVKVKDNEQLLSLIKETIDYKNTVPAFVKKHPERYKKK